VTSSEVVEVKEHEEVKIKEDKVTRLSGNPWQVQFWVFFLLQKSVYIWEKAGLLNRTFFTS
jgi:hypothetical protein